MSGSIIAWRALAAVLLAGTAWRIASSPYAPTFDDAWYLETSFRLWSALKAGPLAFASAYTEAFRIKAPLISLIPLPLYALFGMGERVALWANLPLLAWTGWSMRRIGTRTASPETGEAAAALTLAVPLLYGLARLFFVETLLVALVCAVIAEALEPRPRALRLGVLVGLGLLAKSIFPLYVAVPLWSRRKELRPIAGRAAIAALLIASTWYAFNLPYVAGFAFSAGFGKVGQGYANGLGTWISSLLRDGLSWPLAAAGVLAALAGRSSSRLPLLWAAPLAVCAIGVNKEIRFAAPLLPAFALWAAAGWASLSGGRRAAAQAALAGAALLVFAGQALRAAPALAYNEDYPPLHWDRSALLDALAGASAESVVAVGIEHPCLNANNLASLAASRGLPWRTISLGYAQTSAEGAMIRLRDKNADHLVMVSGSSDLPPSHNLANAGVEAAVVSGRLRARRVSEVPLAPGVTAAVYRLR